MFCHKNFLVQKDLGPKNSFGPTIIWFPKMLGQQKFVVQKKLCTKKKLIQNILYLKILGPQNILSKLDWTCPSLTWPVPTWSDLSQHDLTSLNIIWHQIDRPVLTRLDQLRYFWYVHMSPEQMLPGQMPMWHLESVLDVPRNLPLKFHKNRVSNSWDIHDMDKFHPDSWNLF